MGSMGVTFPSSARLNLYVSSSWWAVRPSGSASRAPGRGDSEASEGRTAIWRRSSFAEGARFSKRKGALTRTLALPTDVHTHLLVLQSKS